MKYINIKSSVFTLMLTSFPSVQAFNLNDYFNNSSESDDVAQEEVVAPAQQQTQSYKMGRREQHKQWILQCIEGNVSGDEKCNLIHQINNEKNQQIMKVELLNTGKENIMLFHLPLGAYLPAGATLKVGESAIQMPIVTCLLAGCQAKTSVDWNLNQKLKREEKAIVQLVHMNQQQKINIEFSLMGYSKGSKEIK